MAKVLILGCGDIGVQLAQKLTKIGHAVTAVRRSQVNMPGIDFRALDLNSAEALGQLETDFDFIYFMVTPGGRTEEAYRNIYSTMLNQLLEHFSSSKAQWIFVSSTSVYGQNAGEWVDEKSIIKPARFNGRYIAQAEEKILAANPNNCIVRFSGIYGPGRTRLISKALENSPVQCDPPAYTNRIHRDDCVGILTFICREKIAGKALENVYLASDCEPVPQAEVMTFIRQICGRKEPLNCLDTPNANMNKRCNNQAIRQLGYQFLYPSYRDFYPQLIEEFLKKQ